MMDEARIQQEVEGYEEVEYGMRLDCIKNGCDPIHTDHNRISPLSRRMAHLWDKDFVKWINEHRTKAHKINNHAATFVERVVTYGAWEDA